MADMARPPMRMWRVELPCGGFALKAESHDPPRDPMERALVARHWQFNDEFHERIQVRLDKPPLPKISVSAAVRLMYFALHIEVRRSRSSLSEE